MVIVVPVGGRCGGEFVYIIAHMLDVVFFLLLKTWRYAAQRWDEEHCMSWGVGARA